MSEGGIDNGVVEPAVADCCMEADRLPPDCRSWYVPRPWGQGTAMVQPEERIHDPSLGLRNLMDTYLLERNGENDVEK